MIQIIILIVLILLNAFFAAAEIAFISLNDAKIDVMAREGNKKAKKIVPYGDDFFCIKSRECLTSFTKRDIIM